MRSSVLLPGLCLALAQPCAARDAFFAWAWPADSPILAYEMLYTGLIGGVATQTMQAITVANDKADCVLSPQELAPGERSVCGRIPCPPPGSYSFLLRAKRGEQYSDFSNIAQMGIGSACEDMPFLVPRENPIIAATPVPAQQAMPPPVPAVMSMPLPVMAPTPAPAEPSMTAMPMQPAVPMTPALPTEEPAMNQEPALAPEASTETEDSPTTILTTYEQELTAIETSYMGMLTDATNDVPRATRHDRHHIRDLHRAYARARHAQERAYQRALARMQRHMARYQARHQYRAAQEDE